MCTASFNHMWDLKGNVIDISLVALQIRVPTSELIPLLQKLSTEQLHWKELQYPEVKATAE